MQDAHQEPREQPPKKNSTQIIPLPTCAACGETSQDSCTVEENTSIHENPCILVIFGASGDLTGKKLVPALYNMMLDGQLPANFVCLGFARRDKTDEAFREEMLQHIRDHSRTPPDEQNLRKFADKIFYHRSEFNDDNGYESLSQRLSELDKQKGTKGNRIFYLSVQPKFFSLIVEKLKQHNLIYAEEKPEPFSRVIIEKPFGHDLQSAYDLQHDLTQHLSEHQIYRIDHYLGKETVQNLLVFRFSNSIFEGLWNHRYVNNIQITVGESIGIEERGSFYESSGLLRDIVQNHLMQLLTLVTMEPPTSLSPDAIRDEKVKVLQALEVYKKEDVPKWAVRGQYAKGLVDGKEVKAYREEDNVNPESNVETFAALKLQIDNWRWAGVPIFIRAGKRLPKRATEIVISFKKAPDVLFNKDHKITTTNKVVFRIQPNEGTSICFHSKIPGTSTKIKPVSMDFQYATYFGQKVPEAYERLIYDCILGDGTLFARVDESLNSWKFLSPILDTWSQTPLHPEEFYPAGTWGTKAASDLLQQSQHTWNPI